MSKDIMASLAEPFETTEIKCKPQTVKGNRALAVFYVDCRVVQDRLDEVLGVGGWQDDYTILPDGSVMCRLRLKIGEEWITKVDVGSPSEQPDGGDRMKSAFSDALKRAAVKFGIGRYIYRIPHTWADFDPQTKKFATQPQLPRWAIPGTAQKQPPAQQQTPAASKPAPPQQKAPLTLEAIYTRMQTTAPKTGADLSVWLNSLNGNLMLILPDYQSGELIESVAQSCAIGPNQLAAITNQSILMNAWVRAKEYVKGWTVSPVTDVPY